MKGEVVSVESGIDGSLPSGDVDSARFIVDRYVELFEKRFGRKPRFYMSKAFEKAKELIEVCGGVDAALEYLEIYLSSDHELAMKNGHSISHAPGLYDIVMAHADTRKHVAMMDSFPFLSSLDAQEAALFMRHLTNS